ncbi:MAG: Fic family protein [Gammaproteobacteria bacterium]|nr:Fic family protein [Gammaproteobacteria bacterium]
MLDDNWELINGPPAHRIEQLNFLNTVNVIEALVTFQAALTQSNTIPPMPTEGVLRELHRTGTLLLLQQPGAYRQSPVNVYKNGQIVYRPPPHAQVPGLMADMFTELQQIWQNGDALDAAAYALWRVNWVHPFKNGNGRTARAFAYGCLCARLGVVLPGQPTVIEQIMVTRDEYEAAIRAGDAAAANDPNARDLGPMKAYLNRLLQTQIASIIPNPTP